MPSEPNDDRRVGRHRLVDLSGSWSARPTEASAGEPHGDHYAAPDVWADIEVPGHWTTHPDFADEAGPMRYRTTVRTPPPDEGRRRWLDLDGVFYQADVWLDDSYLGDPEGYFTPNSFDIGPIIDDGQPHDLELEVVCPSTTPERAGTTITGTYQGFIDQNWNPGGLAGDIAIVETGPVRIERLRILCRDADEQRAHLLVTARLNALSEGPVRIHTLVEGAAASEFEHTVAGGTNEVSWSIDIAEPTLWWPHRLGSADLVDIAVEVTTEGICSDRIDRRVGLREVAWDRWICSINGERLFLKGADLVPIRLDAASIGRDEIEHLLNEAVDAGLDAIRVHGHIAPDALYSTADRLGLLILQDFPLMGSQSRRIRARAAEQAIAAVDRLGHHPSLVLWWAHGQSERSANQPGHESPTGEMIVDQNPRRPRLIRRLLSQQRPDLNRAILDRWVKRAIENADPTRPCVAQSGSLPHLPLLDGADAHLWFGWSDGEVDELTAVARRMPRLVRFVSEFGSQSLPSDTGFIETDRWPELEWAHLTERHGAEPDELLGRFDPARFAGFEEFRAATQAHQAAVIRYTVETLRRLKYRPTGGFCVFALNDPVPAISYSIIDHTRTRLPAYDALQAACRPILAVAELPAEGLAAGRRHRIAIHVINDLRYRIDDATITVDATCDGLPLGQWSFGGSVEADECQRVGRVTLEVPDNASSLEVSVVVTRSETSTDAIVNRYEVEVIST